MIQFKRFAAGKFSDGEVGRFFNGHLIENSKVLENGDIAVYYRLPNDLGMDDMDRLERLNNAIKSAETEIYDAELGLMECDGNLADIEAEIAKTTPNEKDKWEALQRSRKENEDQRRMHKKTVDGRGRQVFDLRTKAAKVLKRLGK